MSDESKSARGTKQRVLDSACKVFADKGFRDATVQDICREAEANVAAVNYYFGSKENLYREVWRYASEIMLKAYAGPPQGDMSPEARLRAIMAARIKAVFDEGSAGWFPKIIMKEVADSGHMTLDLHGTFLMPRIRELKEIVGELLGEKATGFQIHICTMSVHSQYVFLNVSRRIHHLLFEGHVPDEVETGEIISHITTFVLSGIRGVREQIEKDMQE